jgi:hypothetical protein
MSTLFSQARARWEAELEKCVLRCKPCHLVKTRICNDYAYREIGHGGGSRGKIGCKCELCREKYRKYRRAYQPTQRVRLKEKNK